MASVTSPLLLERTHVEDRTNPQHRWTYLAHIHSSQPICVVPTPAVQCHSLLTGCIPLFSIHAHERRLFLLLVGRLGVEW